MRETKQNKRVVAPITWGRYANEENEKEFWKVQMRISPERFRFFLRQTNQKELGKWQYAGRSEEDANFYTELPLFQKFRGTGEYEFWLEKSKFDVYDLQNERLQGHDHKVYSSTFLECWYLLYCGENFTQEISRIDYRSHTGTSVLTFFFPNNEEVEVYGLATPECLENFGIEDGEFSCQLFDFNWQRRFQDDHLEIIKMIIKEYPEMEMLFSGSVFEERSFAYYNSPCSYFLFGPQWIIELNGLSLDSCLFIIKRGVKGKVFKTTTVKFGEWLELCREKKGIALSGVEGTWE